MLKTLRTAGTSATEVSQMFLVAPASGLRNTAMLNRESKNLFDNTQGRGRRINIFGVWEPGVHFDYALMVGTLKAPTYVQLMEWQATKAQQQIECHRTNHGNCARQRFSSSQSIGTTTG